MNPLIVQYYDVIGDKMIKRIKQEAEPWLARSRTIDDARPGARVLTNQRTSANTWINDHILQPFTAIPKKISALTGLNVNGLPAAEPLQVVSYGVGAYSAVHNDAVRSVYFSQISVSSGSDCYSYFTVCLSYSSTTLRMLDRTAIGWQRYCSM